MKYKLQLYNAAGANVGLPATFTEFENAVDIGYRLILHVRPGHAQDFHVFADDDAGNPLELPNGKKLYIGRWNDKLLNRGMVK